MGAVGPCVHDKVSGQSSWVLRLLTSSEDDFFILLKGSGWNYPTLLSDTLRQVKPQTVCPFPRE